MKKIILFGAGGHANSVIDVIENTKKFKILFLVDTFNGQLGKYKVLKENKNLNYYKKFSKNVIVTIGQIKSSLIREKLYKKLKNHNFNFPIIISPKAHVSKSSKISEGTIVMHHALLNSNCKIKENCIINTKALIEHDVTINKNTHISTGAIINGGCTINKNCFIGSNATLIQNITIKAFSVIGAGKIIKKNI